MQGGYDLEIGAGQGLHAIRYCQAHPTRTLVAIERTHTKFARLQSRRARHPELYGLWPVQADALAVVAHFVQPAQLDRVFMLYPNPNAKPKHAHLRFHNSPFMGHLRLKMKPGAELHLATNLQWYADEAKAALTGNWGFQLLEERELHGPQVVPRTHFEKKYLVRGEHCYDLRFKNSDN